MKHIACHVIGIRLAGSIGIIPTVRFWDDRDIVSDRADASDPWVTRMIESPRAVFEGWRFRSHETTLGIMAKIRSLFIPRNDIRSLVDERLTEACDRGDIVVGVHMRWEDYRGNPQFFPVGVFLNLMKHVATLLKPSIVSFLVSSPEKLDTDDFPKDCIICAGGGPTQDMYTLASYDYIIGPVSTFSRWAFFYGGKPLFAKRGDVRFHDLSKAEIIRWLWKSDHMSEPNVYLVLPVHNRSSMTKAFCDSLARQTHTNFVLVLVDDGSTDGSAELVAGNSFRTHICRSDGNFWWAGGLRRGLSRVTELHLAPDDVVLMVNDDASFDDDFLEKAVREVRQDGALTMLSVPVLFRDSGRRAEGGFFCDWPHFTFSDYDCASTRCHFARYADLKRCGRFRPGLLPHYRSDLEFTIRAPSSVRQDTSGTDRTLLLDKVQHRHAPSAHGKFHLGRPIQNIFHI